MISSEGAAEAVLARAARWHVGHGDALDLLRHLPDASVDACVTDPPGGIGFMGKAWDNPLQAGAVPLAVALREALALSEYPRDARVRAREGFVHWLATRLGEVHRVLKPGAHALVWSIPRTTHWTGLALEYAGFELIDQIDHLYSQGGTKSKSARRVLAMHRCARPGRHFESSLPKGAKKQEGDHVCADYAAPDEWDGYGTGLAPAHEGWWLARKPLEGTIAENLEKWGTGVIDIDGSRIPVHDGIGRWPKNVIFTHAPGCRMVGTTLIVANPTWDTPNRATAPALFTGERVSPVRHTSRAGEASAERRYTGRGSASLARTPGERRDESEEVDVWDCESGCAVLRLHQQGGNTQSGFMRAGAERVTRFGSSVPLPEIVRADTIGDAGPVTRFYLQLPRTEPGVVPFQYQAKPTRREKDAGLTHFRRRPAAEATGSKDGAGRTGDAKNAHPTTKDEELMRYYVRLTCPPGGVVVDPFTGSGSTGVAAIQEGRRFIGYEINNSDAEPHVEVARARIHYADGAGELVPRESLRETERDLGVFRAKGA